MMLGRFDEIRKQHAEFEVSTNNLWHEGSKDAIFIIVSHLQKIQVLRRYAQNGVEVYILL